jgi:hypothetical protein
LLVHSIAKGAREHFSSDSVERVEFLLIIVFFAIQANSILQYCEKEIIGGSNGDELLVIAQKCDLVASGS